MPHPPLHLKIWCVLIAVGCLHMVVEQSFAEWYVAGYGGVTTMGSIGNVTMNNLGERLALQQFPSATPPSASGDTVTQSFDTSDISLKSSPVFGAKVGYFFTDNNLPWLGIELEAFTSKPNIKSQTLSSVQNVTFSPGPVTITNCNPITAPQFCPQSVRTNSQVSLTETSLRVTTVAFSVVARYPGERFQPYVGVGAGAFYFSASSGSFRSFQGTQPSGSIKDSQWVPGLNAFGGLRYFITKEWGLFGEAKYNNAPINELDSELGISGTYSILNFIGGIAYRF